MANPVLRTGQASPTSVYETSTTQQHEIGVRGVLGDRTFRYAKFMNGTAIGPNKLAQMAPPVAEHVSEANDPFVINSTNVPFTPAAVVIEQDEYAEGYIKVEGGTLGIGQIYKLKSHAYKAASAATTFDLYDSVVTATTGSEVCSLIHNPYAYVVIQPTTITAPAAGVPLVNVAAVATASVDTAGYLKTAAATWTQPRYVWLQTWGVASVLLDTTALVAGHGVIVGAVAGSVGVAVETDIKQRVGVAMEAMTTDNIYASIFLTIAP